MNVDPLPAVLVIIMEAEGTGELLEKAEGKAFLGAVLVVFITCQLGGLPLLVLLLWCAAAGLLCAYLLFRILPRLPNLLPHIQHTPNVSRTRPQPPLVLCPVCNEPQCKRHGMKKRREYLNPWDDLIVPYSVDCAMSEVLELIMQRFVYSWHRPLSPASESFEDEMRVAIRHAAAIVLRRAQKIDLPQLITSKFLQVIASHINIYVKAREKLPANAPVADIEAAVMQAYGDHTHIAMRGPTGNVRYFRHVARTLLPLLLPEDMLQSRMLCSLVEELFASRVFVPAMNFTAKPDFLNKMLLIVFDKNSRLERIFGPVSKDVPFLSKWALSRSRHSVDHPLALNIPLPELLDPQHNLYVFIQFMKSLDHTCIIQVYLTLSDLKQKVNSFEDEQASGIVDQVENLYQTYLIPISPSYLQLDSEMVAQVATVLSDRGLTAAGKCESLKRLNVFGRLRGYIYQELFVKIYYPRFLKSTMFYQLYLGKKTDKDEAEPSAIRSKGDRWRNKTKHLKKLSLSQRSVDSSSPEHDTGADSVLIEEDGGVADSSSSSSGSSKPCLIPKHVQIVDVENHTDSIRPYNEYVIVVKKGDGDVTKTEVVKRRYKEFVGLDTKLQQFHSTSTIKVQLPSKKAFRNMDKAFVDTRCKELEQYLSTLITLPRVLDSQILTSFLSADSDPALFLPETVTDKMRKVVKRDKPVHIEDVMRVLLQGVEPASNQPSPQTVAHVTAQAEANAEKRKTYLEDLADDMSVSESTRHKPWLHSFSSDAPTTKPVHMRCVMDLLLFVATSVYRISPLQLTVLMLVKLLSQDTVEALAYKFVAHKVELMLTEAHILRIIRIFRDNLFFSKAPPRKEEDIKDRFQQTVQELLRYPSPLVVKVIGETLYQEGTGMLIEGLQCRELNKQLFFKMLDIILLELFPELEEGGKLK